MRTRPLIMGFLLVLVLAVPVLIGLASIRPGGGQQAVADVRRIARETLGLPKFWYDTARVARGHGSAVACPDPARTLAIVTGGQSNAANSFGNRTRTERQDQVFAFDNGSCFVAADPMAGSSGDGGSLWPELGKRLHAETGRPVLFIGGAIGGFQVRDWLDRRSGYWANLARRIADAQRLGYAPEWIIWHQGEADAATGISPDQFKAELAQLTSDLLAAVPSANLYLFQATRCSHPRNIAGVPELRMAQVAVARENPRIVTGLNTDTLDNDDRSDGCHFNAAGQNRINTAVTQSLTGF